MCSTGVSLLDCDGVYVISSLMLLSSTQQRTLVCIVDDSKLNITIGIPQTPKARVVINHNPTPCELEASPQKRQIPTKHERTIASLNRYQKKTPAPTSPNTCASPSHHRLFPILPPT
jgi:hypothetical protein